MTPERWKQVRTVLHRAMDLDRSGRIAYLDSACAGDADLRREVESLVEASEQSGVIVDTPLIPRPATAFSAGEKIAQYQIVEKIGEGGMGSVFKAKDTQLGRTVAMKVLHPQAAADPDRRARFVQEARSASALNHPNIITIHDLLRHSGSDVIVMEFVDGQPLDRMLQKQKGLPPQQVLRIGIEVSGALAKAHSAGIVHRDLKPANILINQDGLAKVVDFGIAKLTERTHSSVETLTIAPNSSPAPSPTEKGMVIGTAAYMSPEQAEGQPVDARSDTFSFGSVLYEMATGRKAFQGESAISTLSAVLRDEPAPITEISPALPAELSRIVARCMRKDPARRFQHIVDVRVALEELRDEIETGRATAAHTRTRGRKRMIGVAGAAAFGVACMLTGAVGLFLLSDPEKPAQSMEPLVTDQVAATWPAWSPDGKTLAYVTPGSGKSRIRIRTLLSPTSTVITEHASAITDLDWWPDGTRLYYRVYAPKRLWYSVGAAGGAPQVLDERVAAIAIAPDGKTQVVMATSPFTVWLGPPDRRQPVSIPGNPPGATLVDPTTAAFAPDGKKVALSFVNTSHHADAEGNPLIRQIWILPLNGGKPYRVLHHVKSAFRIGRLPWMPDSRRLVVQIRDQDTARLHAVDVESGRMWLLTNTTVREGRPTVAPDGRTVAFESLRTTRGLVEVALSEGGAITPLTSNFQQAHGVWLPDGESLAYVAAGEDEIWIRNASGAWARPAVTASEAGFARGPVSDPRVSPDGQRVLFALGGSKHQIFVAPVTGGKAVAIDPENADQHSADWSPDGQWIVYTRRRKPGGLFEVVKSPSGGGSPSRLRDGVQVGAIVRWSPAGEAIAVCSFSKLLLISPDGQQQLDMGRCTGAFTFSRDGRVLYGIEGPSVFAIDTKTGIRRKVRDLGLEADSTMAINDINREGTRLMATITTAKTEIWMLKGVDPWISGPVRWFPWLYARGRGPE